MHNREGGGLERGEKKKHSLSGGERKMVAVARSGADMPYLRVRMYEHPKCRSYINILELPHGITFIFFAFTNCFQVYNYPCL